jgi:undecaprenyl-diphosphatase
MDRTTIMTDLPAKPTNPPSEGAAAPLTSPALSPGSPQQVMHDYLAFFRGRTVVLAILILTALFSLMTILVVRADLLPTFWDINVTHEIQEFPYMPLGAILIAVSAPGFQPWNWIMIAALVVFFIFPLRRPVEAFFVGLAGAGGLLAEVVKGLVDRPRPTPEFVNVIGNLKSYSFPSGHVTGYTILFGFLFYLTFVHLHKRMPLRLFLLVFFALMVFLVGPSRVYMGQHWASDALAGYALGFAYLLLIIELYRFWMKRKTRTENAPRET